MYYEVCPILHVFFLRSSDPRDLRLSLYLVVMAIMATMVGTSESMALSTSSPTFLSLYSII